MRTVTEMDAWTALFGSRDGEREGGAGGRGRGSQAFRLPEVDLKALFRDLREGRVDEVKLQAEIERLREVMAVFDSWLNQGAEIRGVLGDAVTILDAAIMPEPGVVDDRLRRLRRKYRATSGRTRGPRGRGRK